MKNIALYEPEKYQQKEYEQVADHIYKTKDNDGIWDLCYVTSLRFEQEPEFGEGEDSSNISQYPLEDIEDKFLVAISDFYEEKNDGSSNVCYLEFAGEEPEQIEDLLSIVGKHVYNKNVDEDGQTYVELVIE